MLYNQTSLIKTRVTLLINNISILSLTTNTQLPVTSYFDDENDNELLNLIPLLERISTNNGAVVPINMCYNN